MDMSNIKLNIRKVETTEEEVSIEDIFREKNIKVKLPVKDIFATGEVVKNKDDKEILQIFSTNDNGVSYLGNVEAMINDTIYMTFSLLRKKLEEPKDGKEYQYYFVTPFKTEEGQLRSLKPNFPRFKEAQNWNGVDQKSYMPSNGSGEEVVQSTVFAPFEVIYAIKLYVDAYCQNCATEVYQRKTTATRANNAVKASNSNDAVT